MYNLLADFRLQMSWELWVQATWEVKYFSFCINNPHCNDTKLVGNQQGFTLTRRCTVGSDFFRGMSATLAESEDESSREAVIISLSANRG